MVEAVSCGPRSGLAVEPLDMEMVMRQRWDSLEPSRCPAEADSEEEDLDGIPFEDEEGRCDESDVIDWDSIIAGHGLSAWDRLGEKYEQNASEICGFSSSANEFISYNYSSPATIGI